MTADARSAQRVEGGRSNGDMLWFNTEKGHGFIETAAGDMQVRLTDAGTTNVAADAGTRTLAAGQTYLLVIATPSSFLAPGCP